MDDTLALKLREIRAAKFAADPEGMRAKKRAYDQKRYAEHRDEMLAKQRARKAALSPEQKEVRNAYERAWRAKHPDLIRAYNRRNIESGYRREWAKRQRALDPERYRRKAQKWRLKSKYGITLETYDAMLAEQGGMCAICGRPESMAIKGTTCTLAVDHDHASKRVRGLLCVNCNMLIGGARHDPAVLRAAIAYLER